MIQFLCQEGYYMDTKLLQLPQASESDFINHKENSMRLRGYFNRSINFIGGHLVETKLAVALFDKDGYLLKIVGNKTLLQKLEKDGIKRGTVWTLSGIGSNAVTEGLKSSTTISSTSTEDVFPPLKNYSITFSPVIVSTDEPPIINTLLGGIAIFGPKEENVPNLCLMAKALVNDLVLHIYSTVIYLKLWEGTGKAVLYCDLNTHTRKASTLYHSKEIFSVLGIPEDNIYYRPLEDIFDPLPHNKEFWNIIQGRQKIYRKEVSVSVRGKHMTLILSTDLYIHTIFDAEGIMLSITTPQLSSSRIARKVGNTAVLSFDNIVGQSPAIINAKESARQMAMTDSNLLLIGESGVGKDVFAQAIHNASPRRDNPFIVLNCGALPRELIASELFGYDGGAFTGANRQGNIGKFELANNGTLFLDEIGELPLDLQASLLRVVEQKQFMRLGSSRIINANVRIIAATNANLPEMIRQNRFRVDLYYRLNTLQITIPPLRNRREDIPLLSEHFAYSINQRIGHFDHISFTPEAMVLLRQQPWSGNIRQLQNVIERVVLLTPDGVITAEDIARNLDDKEKSIISDANAFPASESPIAHTATGITKEQILKAFAACGGNRSNAAEYLGISRKTLYRYIEKFGIDAKFGS